MPPLSFFTFCEESAGGDFFPKRETNMERKEILFTLSWLVSLVGLFSAVAHCWTTRHQRQVWLLVSKSLLVVSILLALPYQWPLALARYRLIGNAVLFAACAALLATSFVS